MHAYFLLINLGIATWIGVDAHKIGVRRGRLGGGFLDMGVVSWVVSSLFIWVITLPCYLVARGRYQTMAAVSAQPPAGWPAPYAAAPVAFGAPVTLATSPVPDPAAEPVTAEPAATVPAPVAVAPPQLSPDGHWWWDGAAWVPAHSVAQPVSPS